MSTRASYHFQLRLSAALVLTGFLLGCHDAVPPVARFRAMPIAGPAPLEVTFTDQSVPGSGILNAWAWDFGDGQTSTETNPTHVYERPGYYTVSLVIDTNGNKDAWTFANMISVTGPAETASADAGNPKPVVREMDTGNNRPEATRMASVAPMETKPQGASTYFVSPNGDDGHDGSADRPWRTIQHAAEAASAGDTVRIAPGTYSGNVDFPRSGTPAAPIKFLGESPETVVVTGHLQLSRGVSYFELGSLRVEGFRIWGVTLIGDNHHVHLHDLKVVGGETGIRFTDGNSGDPPAEGPVSDVVVENCEVQGPMYSAVDCTPGPCDRMVFRRLDLHDAGVHGQESFGADGLALERGQDVLVEDCRIHDNGGDGIDLNSRNFEGKAKGIVVRRNQVLRNHLMGIKLWAGGRMENNVVWGQGITPVLVGKYPGTYEVVNNTVAFNMYAQFAERDYAFVAGYPNDDTGVPPEISLTLVNNIFAFNTGPGVGDGPTGIYLGAKVRLKEGHNLFWSRDDGEIQAEFVNRPEKSFSRVEVLDGTWASATGQGAGDMAADPRFTAPWPNVDVNLFAGSPAADAGTEAGAPHEDARGATRPQGAGYSIGAFER